MRSISKVLTALACGILIDREIITEDTLVYPIVKDLVNITNLTALEKVKKWKIKHLLTYSCGYPTQMFSRKFIQDKNPSEFLDYLFNYDLIYEPGEKHVYNNAETYILSVIIQLLTGKNLSDFVNEEIFKPLNINSYEWKNYGDYCAGGTGLLLSHRDMFKIAELIFNQGVFDGKQLISQKYIAAMCSTQIATPYDTKPERVLPKYGVGYIMHISRDGFVFKDGTNGQYIIINKAKNLLITILASEIDMPCVLEILRDLV